jgi:hypothetical protein
LSKKKVKLETDDVDVWVATLRSTCTALYNVGQDQLMGEVQKIVTALEGLRNFKEEPKANKGKGDVRMPDADE